MQKRTPQLTAKENEVRKSLTCCWCESSSRNITHQSSCMDYLPQIFILIPLLPESPVKHLHTRTGLQEQSSPCTDPLLLPQTGEPQQPHREKPRPCFRNQGPEHKGRRGGKENAYNNNNKNNKKGLLTEAMPFQLGCRKTQITKALQPFTYTLPSNQTSANQQPFNS